MKKGFTLIELMAVIIVLGIIAVITAPIMGDVIEKSKRGAFEDSVYELIKAVNLDKADHGFNINQIYTITGGVISPSIETKGSVNGNGTLKIDEDGNIFVNIEFDKWCASKELYDNRVTLTDGACIVNSDTANANVPYLLSNMIPVRWDGAKWVKADHRNPAATPWYNYTNKQWANAVVVKETGGTQIRDYYLSDAAIGQEVKETDILGYFVWIPRYQYAIPSTPVGVKTISIQFESSIPEKTVGTAIDNSYLTHPAFTLGTNELSGFWVSKFETTGTNTLPTIKPSIVALTSASTTEGLVFMNEAIDIMQLSDNIYGFVPDNMDLRIMKNNEWGAVAYLSMSIYGFNSEVWKNPSTTYITGCAGATGGAVGAPGCANLYTTTNGLKASTTGNIYGIYDMAGGGYDIVMGNYNDNVGESGFFTMPDTKYYNKFITTTSTTACNGTICYGQAMSETNAWQSAQAVMPTTLKPWIGRGSASTLGGRSIFSYGDSTGNLTGGGLTGMTFHLTLSYE